MAPVCKCFCPSFCYLDYEEEAIFEENCRVEVSVARCKACGQKWLKYLLEEPHYSKSGRWWRVPIQNELPPIGTAAEAKLFIEGQSWCFVGGSFFESTGHIVQSPIKVV